jgi:WD40 repeat protein
MLVSNENGKLSQPRDTSEKKQSDRLFRLPAVVCLLAVVFQSQTPIHSDRPELVPQTGHSDYDLSVAFSPDGRWLASVNQDSTIKIWQVSLGYQLRTLKGHVNRVLAVAFSPDGRSLASGGYDKTIRLWEVGTGQEVRTRNDPKPVMAVAFSPNGTSLASGSYDKTIKLWDIATARELRALIGHTGGINAIAFSADGSLLVSGSQDKTMKLWDVRSGHESRPVALAVTRSFCLGSVAKSFASTKT